MLNCVGHTPLPLTFSAFKPNESRAELRSMPLRYLQIKILSQEKPFQAFRKEVTNTERMMDSSRGIRQEHMLLEVDEKF